MVTLELVFARPAIPTPYFRAGGPGRPSRVAPLNTLVTATLFHYGRGVVVMALKCHELLGGKGEGIPPEVEVKGLERSIVALF